MTLHEAIKYVLLNYGELSYREIAEKVNAKQLYKRKDGGHVTPSQINARINKYPELFKVNEKDNVGLKSHGLFKLKETIDTVASILESSKSNPDYLKEILLPAVAIFLKYESFFLLVCPFRYCLEKH